MNEYSESSQVVECRARVLSELVAEAFAEGRYDVVLDGMHISKAKLSSLRNDGRLVASVNSATMADDQSPFAAEVFLSGPAEEPETRGVPLGSLTMISRNNGLRRLIAGLEVRETADGNSGRLLLLHCSSTKTLGPRGCIWVLEAILTIFVMVMTASSVAYLLGVVDESISNREMLFAVSSMLIPSIWLLAERFFKRGAIRAHVDRMIDSLGEIGEPS